MGFDLKEYFGLQGPNTRFETKDISTDDFEDDDGFDVIAVNAGDLTCRPLNNDDDAGDFTRTVGEDEYFMLGQRIARCKAVRANATVSEIIAAYPTRK